jgi:hypothetical protein
LSLDLIAFALLQEQGLHSRWWNILFEEGHHRRLSHCPYCSFYQLKECQGRESNLKSSKLLLAVDVIFHGVTEITNLVAREQLFCDLNF